MTYGRPCGKSLAELELEIGVSRFTAPHFSSPVRCFLLCQTWTKAFNKVKTGQLLYVTYWRSRMECYLILWAGL